MSEKDATVIYVTLSGSLHRHTAAIAETAAEFETRGGVVLSPTSREVQREDEEGFVYLTGDRGKPWEIEGAHLAAIGRSDLCTSSIRVVIWDSARPWRSDTPWREACLSTQVSLQRSRRTSSLYLRRV